MLHQASQRREVILQFHAIERACIRTLVDSSLQMQTLKSGKLCVFGKSEKTGFVVILKKLAQLVNRNQK
jgi:hypothetical protein